MSINKKKYTPSADDLCVPVEDEYKIRARDKYYFSIGLAMFLGIPYLMGMVVLIPEEKLLQTQIAAVSLYTVIWALLYILKVSLLNELASITFAVMMTYSIPTLLMLPFGFIHDDRQVIFEGTCYYTSGAKRKETKIGNIDGFHDIIVSTHSFFKSGQRCNYGDDVRIHSLQSFYGYRVFYVEVTDS